MQVSCDTSKLEQSLKKFHEDAVRKMQGMVQIFSYKVTVEAIDNTPYGDDEVYFKYYNLKSRLKWFLPYRGSAKGGWTISMNTPSRILVPERADSVDAINIKENADNASVTYKLGDVVYIMNSVPYMNTPGFTQSSFDSLENGYSAQAPFGVMEPTLHAILGIYQSDLKSYYEAS
jgi:hypothetical protein